MTITREWLALYKLSWQALESKQDWVKSYSKVKTGERREPSICLDVSFRSRPIAEGNDSSLMLAVV